MSSKKIGRVSWFNNNRGYGFILNEHGEDVFVHHRAIMMDGYKTLIGDQLVEFIQVKSEKGWQAAEVVAINDTSEIEAPA